MKSQKLNLDPDPCDGSALSITKWFLQEMITDAKSFSCQSNKIKINKSCIHFSPSIMWPVQRAMLTTFEKQFFSNKRYGLFAPEGPAAW